MSWKPLAIISGFLWLGMGGFLLVLGSRFLRGAVGEEMLLAALAPCLLLGILKGRLLRKSASRQVERLRSFEGSIPLWRLYSGPYYLLLASMMGVGMLFNYLGVSPLVRGVIDVAVGCALINGSSAYFRSAYVICDS